MSVNAVRNVVGEVKERLFLSKNRLFLIAERQLETTCCLVVEFHCLLCLIFFEVTRF